MKSIWWTKELKQWNRITWSNDKYYFVKLGFSFIYIYDSSWCKIYVFLFWVKPEHFDSYCFRPLSTFLNIFDMYFNFGTSYASKCNLVQFLQCDYFVFIWDHITNPHSIFQIPENWKMKPISLLVGMRMVNFFIFPKPRFVAGISFLADVSSSGCIFSGNLNTSC